jgi:hypothetical protein
MIAPLDGSGAARLGPLAVTAELDLPSTPRRFRDKSPSAVSPQPTRFRLFEFVDPLEGRACHCASGAG